MLNGLLSNFWYILLVALFFGGSILVHELGHFWAARRRGLKVLRFSIGFGPKIFSWQGKDGVEYRLSWLPLGGYVAIPQLADMSGLEGEGDAEAAKLPPPTYTTRMIVLVAGVVMNVLFAFALACILWKTGVPSSEDSTTTRIGYVSQTLELADKSVVPSPAFKAGLKPGDVILSIDGSKVEVWKDVMLGLMTGSRLTVDGRPKTELVVDRDGKQLSLTLHPQIAGDDKMRRIGVLAYWQPLIHSLTPGSAAEKAGFQRGDRILAIDDTPILNPVSWQELTESKASTGMQVKVRRAGAETVLTLPALPDPKAGYGFAGIMRDTSTAYPSPFSQLAEQSGETLRILGGILNINSNIGLNAVGGPLAILVTYHDAAKAGWVPLLSLTILINISLAIFNLLPIPVLDGGHMVLATIAKLRGSPLPPRFIAGAQGLCIIFLLVLFAWITSRDAINLHRRATAEKPAASAPAAPPSAPAPAPSQPAAPTPSPTK